MAFLSQAQLDQEVRIESERILNVLDTTIINMELALRLPTLVEDNLSRLQPFLGDEDLEIVANCVKVSEESIEVNELGEEVVTSRYTAEGSGTKSRVTMASGDSFNMASQKDRHDPPTSKAIHLLCSKPQRLKKILRQAELSDRGLEFMTYIRRLRDFVYRRLHESVAADHARGLELREAWARNEHAKKEIVELTVKLASVQNETDTLIATKENAFRQYKSDIANLMVDCKHDCKKIASDSEKRMVNACKDDEFRRDLLTQDVKSSGGKLTSLLAEHLHSEKDLRAKRYKVESQLSSWLDKYDNDMGEKQAEWEEIEEGFNQEKEQMALLQDEFDAQEEEYVVLMAEKEEEYQRELEAKMYVFLFNRSARRIQRYWRAYRERKLARRRARRGRRGKSKGGGKKKKK